MEPDIEVDPCFKENVLEWIEDASIASLKVTEMTLLRTTSVADSEGLRLSIVGVVESVVDEPETVGSSSLLHPNSKRSGRKAIVCSFLIKFISVWFTWQYHLLTKVSINTDG